jgi:hypothetical protein
MQAKDEIGQKPRKHNVETELLFCLQLLPHQFILGGQWRMVVVPFVAPHGGSRAFKNKSQWDAGGARLVGMIKVNQWISWRHFVMLDCIDDVKSGLPTTKGVFVLAS